MCGYKLCNPTGSQKCSLVWWSTFFVWKYLKAWNTLNTTVEPTASILSNCLIESMAKIHKKGTSGQAKNFITRTQAVRKLQVSLPDFRRLCIFKGKPDEIHIRQWLIWSRNISSRASKQEKGFQRSNFIYNVLLHKGRSISTSWAFTRQISRPQSPLQEDCSCSGQRRVWRCCKTW